MITKDTGPYQWTGSAREWCKKSDLNSAMQQIVLQSNDSLAMGCSSRMYSIAFYGSSLWLSYMNSSMLLHMRCARGRT